MIVSRWFDTRIAVSQGETGPHSPVCRKGRLARTRPPFRRGKRWRKGRLARTRPPFRRGKRWRTVALEAAVLRCARVTLSKGKRRYKHVRFCGLERTILCYIGKISHCWSGPILGRYMMTMMMPSRRLRMYWKRERGLWVVRYRSQVVCMFEKEKEKGFMIVYSTAIRGGQRESVLSTEMT
jgi:hypothetical protein